MGLLAGTRHARDHHRAAPRTEEAFDLVDFVMTVPVGHPCGIEVVQAALDRADARGLRDRSA